MAHDRYSKDLEEIKKRGVQVIRTPDSVLKAQLAAWDRVIAEQNKEPFFKKVVELQKAWAKRTAPYLLVNNNDTRCARERPTSTSSADSETAAADPRGRFRAGLVRQARPKS